ncbi:hypothetical protein PR048_028671 [Dryococelus australis]|uniref:DDE-1 domain-containing protein n=1 Tax=Dryococelus australis TaxID=614101 RepID=A0ABQ9GB81_9NEOP|nr:hypothetical protein PR048_028671 [Dryococelus australis]
MELGKIHYNAHRVYNTDETGLIVYNITYAERGALITTVTCIYAAGNYAPTLFIFLRKNMKTELMDGGWIQTDIFSKWFDYFVEFPKPTESDPTRLNNVAIICLQPHSTAKMQPLDVEFMKPLKTYYSQEDSKWLRHNQGRVVTYFQIAKLYGLVYQKAATMQNPINSFKKTGLLPCNRDVFSDEDFAIHVGHLSYPTSVKPEPKNPTTGKAALITSSPYLQQLTVSLNRKMKLQDVTKEKFFAEPLKKKVQKSKPRKQSPS